VVVDLGDRKLTRFVKGGGSYLSSGDRRHLFGLGKADRVAKVTVFWPNAKEQHWDGAQVKTEQYVRLVEGKAAVEPARAPRAAFTGN
jgi:hypothetical protein